MPLIEAQVCEFYEPGVTVGAAQVIKLWFVIKIIEKRKEKEETYFLFFMGQTYGIASVFLTEILFNLSLYLIGSFCKKSLGRHRLGQ